MIDGKDYILIVKAFFSYLVDEFDFQIIEEKIIGNYFYDIQYRNDKLIVSISYENIEDCYSVMLYILSEGKMPDYNDKERILYLNELNSSLFVELKSESISGNNDFFSFFKISNEIENKILKSAKELRLCLRNNMKITNKIKKS